MAWTQNSMGNFHDASLLASFFAQAICHPHLKKGKFANLGGPGEHFKIVDLAYVDQQGFGDVQDNLKFSQKLSELAQDCEQLHTQKQNFSVSNLQQILSKYHISGFSYIGFCDQDTEYNGIGTYVKMLDLLNGYILENGVELMISSHCTDRLPEAPHLVIFQGIYQKHLIGRDGLEHLWKNIHPLKKMSKPSF